MNEMYMDIPRVYTALAEWAACCSWIFVSQRRFSGKITAATAGSFLAAQTVFLVVTDDLPIAWWIPCMAMAVGLMYLLILCICEMRPLEAGYCCAWAFLVADTPLKKAEFLHLRPSRRIHSTFLCGGRAFP